MLPERVILKDFLERKPPEDTFIIDELLPRGGLSILSGSPKAGKSTLSRNMIKAIGRGQQFLGRAVVSVPVLYYALEEIPYHIAAEFRMLQCHDEEVYLRAGPIDKSILAKVLYEDIRELSVGIAIVDPLFDALSVVDSNAYSAVNDAMKKLLSVARLTDCHILAVHHTNKSDARGGNSILGSQALAGATECNMFLTKDAKGQRVLSSEQRSGVPFEDVLLSFNTETHEMSVIGSKSVLRAQTAQSEMLAVLDTAELSTSDWLSRCKGRTEYKLQAIHELESQGLVENRSQGRLQLWKRKS